MYFLQQFKHINDDILLKQTLQTFTEKYHSHILLNNFGSRAIVMIRQDIDGTSPTRYFFYFLSRSLRL